MLGGLLKARAVVVASGFLFTAGCYPRHVESAQPQPGPSRPRPDAVVHVPAAADCSCRVGRAGEIASALCRVYKTNRSAKAPFEMLYRAGGGPGDATTTRGTVVYVPSAGTLSVYYDRDASGVQVLPTKQELTALFSFLGSPICRYHAIRALNPADFSYSGGSLVEAVSDDRHVLFYVRRTEGTLHGLSTRWTDGRKSRYTFGAWTFTDELHRR